MRDVVFRVVSATTSQLQAQAETLPIRIAAPTFEDLQHEAREALIQHLGAAHSTYRVRVRRCHSQPLSLIRPWQRQPASRP